MNNLRLLRQTLSIPFIWFMILPAIPFHLCAALYQAVCFRLYGIERVKLTDYVNFDRRKLSYLTNLDKINCAYCSYMNGLFMYVSEIGRRTEYYWCGIKHNNQPNNPAFAYQAKFAEYGNEDDYKKLLLKVGRNRG